MAAWIACGVVSKPDEESEIFQTDGFEVPEAAKQSFQRVCDLAPDSTFRIYFSARRRGFHSHVQERYLVGSTLVTSTHNIAADTAEECLGATARLLVQLLKDDVKDSLIASLMRDLPG